jgi:hypothetical protein
MPKLRENLTHQGRFLATAGDLNHSPNVISAIVLKIKSADHFQSESSISGVRPMGPKSLQLNILPLSS